MKQEACAPLRGCGIENPSMISFRVPPTALNTRSLLSGMHVWDSPITAIMDQQWKNPGRCP